MLDLRGYEFRVKDIADATPYTWNELTKGGKGQPLIYYRQCMHAALYWSGMKLKHVAKVCESKDHTNIIHSINQVKKYLQVGDPLISQIMDEILSARKHKNAVILPYEGQHLNELICLVQMEGLRA